MRFQARTETFENGTLPCGRAETDDENANILIRFRFNENGDI